MFKALAITALVVGVLVGFEIKAQDVPPHSTSQLERDVAIARAKQTLAQALGVPETRIEAVKSEERTWNDSSMGCGKPGTMAMQVITPGYAVILRADGKEHSVHVSQSSAIVCDRPALTRKPSRGARARGVDALIQLAKEDLATQLGVDASTIRVAGMQPQKWPDSSLGCSEHTANAQPGPIPGYRISLRHQKRIYTYHADLKTVRACPPIEKE
jgi:hypothetical protein